MKKGIAMRKLRLQMQMTLNGFVAGPNGELDWLNINWDDKGFAQYVNDFTDASGCILMGRKMMDDFMTHWTKAAGDPHDREHDFARKMVDIPKVVFTKTLQQTNWENLTLAKGDLVAEVKALKAMPGKDLIAYGGATFVSSLLRERLADELYLFINPVTIPDGMRIFHERTGLKLKKATALDCGTVVVQYEFA